MLSNLVKFVIEPSLDAYSEEHGFKSRVLGGSRGGQTMDIASCGQLALELGRDAQDQAAAAQMDVRNYHDSCDRLQLFRSLRRRGVSQSWALAAVRIQRCADIRLRVRNELTAVIPRYRGALTGNRLAPLFGRTIMEDVFSCSDELVRKDIFSLCDVTLWPMAWSDNVVVFANDMRKAGRILSAIARQLHDAKGLTIKPGTPEIIPACTRHLSWPSLHIGGLDISVTDSFKCLGFTITCNGDTTVQKHGMLGALRGLLS